jgi:hypothetical protein
MRRFFFDYTAKDQTMYDFRGDEFSSPESAIGFAQEAASLLQHDSTGAWRGWSIEVRDAKGKRIISLPVERAPLAAEALSMNCTAFV